MPSSDQVKAKFRNMATFHQLYTAIVEDTLALPSASNAAKHAALLITHQSLQQVADGSKPACFTPNVLKLLVSSATSRDLIFAQVAHNIVRQYKLLFVINPMLISLSAGHYRWGSQKCTITCKAVDRCGVRLR